MYFFQCAKLLVLISGRGTTLANLFDVEYQQSEFRIDYVMFGKNTHPEAAEMVRRKFSVKHQTLPSVGTEELSESIFQVARQRRIDFVVLAGFLRYIRVPKDFLYRVVNIHPSLLPAFGGKGMYGNKVHEAVLKSGCPVSGCTVHFVDNTYDHGPIILQKMTNVYHGETVESLSKRVKKLENKAYPEALDLLARNKNVFSR